MHDTLSKPPPELEKWGGGLDFPTWFTTSMAAAEGRRSAAGGGAARGGTAAEGGEEPREQRRRAGEKGGSDVRRREGAAPWRVWAKGNEGEKGGQGAGPEERGGA